MFNHPPTIPHSVSESLTIPSLSQCRDTCSLESDLISVIIVLTVMINALGRSLPLEALAP